LKVLFVIQRWAHFTYHESTINQLCDNGNEVVVLADDNHAPLLADDPVTTRTEQWPNLVLKPMVIKRTGRWRSSLFGLRELLTYADYLNRPEQDPFYLMRWKRYLPPILNRIVRRSPFASRFAATKLARGLLRWFVRMAPADKGIRNYLRESQPDVVVASPTNMRYSEEAEYVKAANELGIPTVVPVLSWDNLTTKGLIHELPNVTLVWNETQKREAVSIHQIPEDRVVVTGSPFLDKWFDNQIEPLSGDTFRERVGLSAGTPFVLYLGSSANIATDESRLVLQLAAHLAKSSDPRLRKIQVLVRPHGANQEPYRKISEPNVTVWMRDRQLPDSLEAFAEFAASLKFSECCLGLNTTGMVDALLMNKPVITLLVDQYRDTNASKAVHYRYLLDAEVYLRSFTTEEAVGLIARLHYEGDSTHARREQFKLDFIRPHGLHRPAGAVAALAIQLAAEGKDPKEIEQLVSKPAKVGAAHTR
jgi:hypothetical protein